MHVANNSHIGVAKDGGAFVLVDGHDIAGFAYTCEMFRSSANAEGEIEPGRDGSPGQTDLRVLGQPVLVGDVARGADGCLEQFGQPVNLSVVCRFTNSHSHSQHDLRALLLLNAGFFYLSIEDLCADLPGDILCIQVFYVKWAGSVGHSRLEHTGTQGGHSWRGARENSRDDLVAKSWFVLDQALLLVNVQVNAISRQAKSQARGYTRREVAPVGGRADEHDARLIL